MNQKSVNMVYLGVFLCLVCAVAAGVMGSVAVMTKEPIAKAKVKKISDGLRAVLPPFSNNPMEDVRTYREADGSEVEFYRAFQNGKLVGVVAKVATSIGYGGRMDGLVSFTPDGKIRTVIVTGHNETPGLGTKVSEDAFRSQFDGFNPKRRIFKVRQDGGEIDAVTAATISSRAVVDAIQRAIDAYNHFKTGK